MLQCSVIFRCATVLNHFSELNHSSCYSAQPFSTELQCSPILVNSVIPHATVLSHFPLSYNTQLFSTATVLTHFAKLLSGGA
jgi:hypothetical protein